MGLFVKCGFKANKGLPEGAGRLVLENKPTAGMMRFNPDITALTSGYYILKFTTERQAFNKKVVIIK